MLSKTGVWLMGVAQCTSRVCTSVTNRSSSSSCPAPRSGLLEDSIFTTSLQPPTKLARS